MPVWAWVLVALGAAYALYVMFCLLLAVIGLLTVRKVVKNRESLTATMFDDLRVTRIGTGPRRTPRRR